MRGLESVGDLNPEIEDQVERKRMEGVADPAGERFAFQQFHGDKLQIRLRVNLVDRTDIRVVQRRGCPGLALEALKRLSVAGHLRRQKFQGDMAPKIDVLG